MSVSVIGQNQISSRVFSPQQRESLIQKIALQTLAEWGLSFGIGLMVSFFVTPITLPYLFSCIAIQCLFSFSLRSLELFFPLASTQAKTLTLLRALTFSQVSGYCGQTLIHESGHALAARLLYRNSSPRITMIPFEGGATSFFSDRLSPLGKAIGKQGSLAWVTVSGAALTLFVSSLFLWLGLRLQRTHPEKSAFLITYSVIDFKTHVFYAISTLWTPSTRLSHDFVHFSALTGVSPVVVALIILAIPLFLYSNTTPLFIRRFSEL